MPRPGPPRDDVQLVARGSILLDLVTDDNIDTLDDEQLWSYWQLCRVWREWEASLAEEAPKKAIKKAMQAARLAEKAPKKAKKKVMKAARIAEKAPKKAIKKAMKAKA